ncbi:hypothetical protein I6F21_34715 [Bradyrhizobium sp. NBAIM03]|nr:hypothetical protein [Bradyrhizobium sp. NBAIM03]MCA1537673.1 hypothetical protein [Bradyrhizobium sp. NBAIM03]
MAFNIIDKDNDHILLVASSEADERAAPGHVGYGPILLQNYLEDRCEP